MALVSFGDQIYNMMNSVFDFWNTQISLIYSYMSISPELFKAGKPWELMEKLNPIFVAVGSSLVVLFFIIGFCAESVNFKEEFRFENMLRMLMKIGLSEWIVNNYLTIMKAMFKSIGNLVKIITKTEYSKMTIGDTEAKMIKDLGFAESILMLILASLMAIIVIICSFFILYTVYFRFMRLFLVVPLGGLALSTVAGGREISNTAKAYVKYFMSVLLEPVIIVVAISVCNSIVSSGVSSLAGSYSNWTRTFIYLAEMTFSVTLTVGIIKGAQNLTSKIFGL